MARSVSLINFSNKGEGFGPLNFMTNEVRTKLTVGDPCGVYADLRPLWATCRAVVAGERAVKNLNGVWDNNKLVRFLLPFSPSMTDAQYEFFKNEAELPGVVAEFSRLVLGGLLRKPPTIAVTDNVPKEAHAWLTQSVGIDGGTMTSLMSRIMWEELQTSRAWVGVDHPPYDGTNEPRPYPYLIKAESVINWRVATQPDGRNVLDRVVIREYDEVYDDENEFHPAFREVVKVHELHEGKYRIRVFRASADTGMIPLINGQRADDKSTNRNSFTLHDTIEDIEMNGNRLDFIPIWPVNGNITPSEPVMLGLVQRELALYNKISRRNHLLYGAATYTPVLMTDMPDDEFDKIVNAGLGSWVRMRPGESATILETPTAALQDMDRAIKDAHAEIANLGVRMLAPETAQSGVALEIRNASQTARLGLLNNQVSAVMSQVCRLLVNWRFDVQLGDADLDFQLSSDFNPAPLGADWLRLATEWYEKNMLPRSAWLSVLSANDMLPPDYDDTKGKEELAEDQANAILTPRNPPTGE